MLLFIQQFSSYYLLYAVAGLKALSMSESISFAKAGPGEGYHIFSTRQ